MKSVIVIPARYGSSRLPGKPLLEIGGEPMVVRVWRLCREVAGVERVVVATDDERIEAAVKGAGGEAVLTDPGHRSGTDRVAEAVAGWDCDVVVNVQGDEPFLDPRAVEELVGYFREGGSDPAATLAVKITDSRELFEPSVVKVMLGREGRAVAFSRFPVPYRREMWEIDGARWQGVEGFAPAELPGPYYKHLGIYAFRADFLREFTAMEPTPGEEAERLEQLRILENGVSLHVVVTDWAGLGVDTARDLEEARRRLGVKA
jgi:3-deoxy-manno-octulosonate cytidylyltransferase (CMP-KDO synthetase)